MIKDRDVVILEEIERLRVHLLGVVPDYATNKDPERRALAPKLELAAQNLLVRGDFTKADESVNTLTSKICQVKLALMREDPPDRDLLRAVETEIGLLMFRRWCLFQIKTR